MWVGGNLFFYFEQGRPGSVVAPDVLLVKGVRKPDGSLVSSTTGLVFRPEGERLRLVDPATGPILWYEELS